MMNVKEQALQVVNSYPEYAKEALENVYRGKVFVVFQPYRNTIEKIAKTKRGAENYIKKQQAFTYYDEYTNELVTCGSGLTVVEIDPTQIENPQTSKTLWYRFMKEYHGQVWYYDNIIKMAKHINVSDDVMEYVLQSIDDMKNNKGLTVLEEAEQQQTETVTKQQQAQQPKEAQKEQQTNVKATYTLNEELNGIEITFTSVPSEDVRNELKNNGFRWSKYKKVWYAKQSAERLQFAQMLAGETEQTEEHEVIQEEAEKLNNTLVNESSEDLQTDNTHNSEPALQVSYKINDEKNGIELYFSDKPNEAIREQLKQYGFKWSHLGFWYAKKTDERLQFVLSLLSESYNIELTEEQQKTLSKRLEKENVKPLRLFKNNDGFILLECLNTNLDDPQPFYFLIRPNGEEIGMGYDSNALDGYNLLYTFEHNSTPDDERTSYDYINIDDIETYIVDERLQEAEHAANWIFRREKINHTNELQNFFMQYNNKTKELLEQTDNERIKYRLKKSLQLFKKRYYDNYVKRLQNKANNPHWGVTGRGNLNKRRYDKALNQYDKLLQEANELIKQMDNAINRTKREIKQDKENHIKEIVKNINAEIEFTTMTKEIEYMGYKERKRVYVYGDYWTSRLWGCYRIFKHNKEIHEMKSTDKLEDAKQYIAYLVQQEEQENAITA